MNENLSLYLICAYFINGLYQYSVSARIDLKNYIKKLCHSKLVGYELINRLYGRHLTVSGDDFEVTLKLIRFLEEYYS